MESHVQKIVSQIYKQNESYHDSTLTKLHADYEEKIKELQEKVSSDRSLEFQKKAKAEILL